MDNRVNVCTNSSHPIIVITAENEFLVVGGGILICQLKMPLGGSITILDL